MAVGIVLHEGVVAGASRRLSRRGRRFPRAAPGKWALQPAAHVVHEFKARGGIARNPGMR